MPAHRDYICPGERYAISRAVHRARLAAGYAACRNCPLRDEDQPAVASESGEKPANRTDTPRRRLFTKEGVRGVARNELDAAAAGRMATALANLLWEDVESGGGRPPASGFPVVVGYDARPWSMPLAVAAGTALRRAGCETIDVGLVTGPEFRFAVAHLEAAAGLLVTGAGSAPAVAGLEFVHASGRPLSAGGGLDRLASLAELTAGRPTRKGGRRREFNTALAYEVGLKRHFAAPRAETCVVGTASPLVRQRLARLGDDLPVSLHSIALPQREAAGDDRALLTTIAEHVCSTQSSFGLWIDESGAACRAVDETGHPVTVADLAGLLLSESLSERPGAPIVVDWSFAEQFDETLLRKDVAVRSNGTAEAMWLSLRDHGASAGADQSGRFWLGGASPACDALIVLARLLHLLTPDRPLSSCRHR